MATVKKSSLQSLLQGTSLPDLPPFDPNWTLKQYEDQQVIWKRKLAEYLRRLGQALTGPNIFNELIQQITTEQLIQLGGGESGAGVPGFGPLKVEVFADYGWVDDTTPFGGTLVGTGKDSSLHIDDLANRWGIGQTFTVDADHLLTRCVRYSGKIVAEATDVYNINFAHDDGGRFYFDGNLVVDAWGGSGQTANDIALSSGQEYPFVMELVQSGSSAMTFRVTWRGSMDSSERDIPFSALRAP